MSLIYSFLFLCLLSFSIWLAWRLYGVFCSALSVGRTRFQERAVAPATRTEQVAHLALQQRTPR